MGGVAQRFGAIRVSRRVGFSGPAGAVGALHGENGAGPSAVVTVLDGAPRVLTPHRVAEASTKFDRGPNSAFDS